MTRSRRPPAQAVAVLLALADEPATWRYGNQLCRQLGIKPGAIYPVLMDLSDRGLLETGWHAEANGRPPRHLYRLSGSGRTLAAELAELKGFAETSTTVAPARRPMRKMRWQGA
jgi:PadR family transcriptional regulator, regulatory protein PadR